MNDRSPPRPKAVVLLSGGLDSSTVLAIAEDLGYEPCAMTFRYGQRHDLEVNAARQIAAQHDIQHHAFVNVDLRAFGGSALTANIEVPKDQDLDEIGDVIPVTYVPARNTIFLSFALAWAEVLPANDIFIGVNAVDYSGYPDCRPQFIKAFQTLANLATKSGVEGHEIHVHTPLIDLTKAEIIAQGLRLGVDYGSTTSCYDPATDGAACGHCDACLLRKRGFEELGVPDPTRYIGA